MFQTKIVEENETHCISDNSFQDVLWFQR